MGYVFDELIVGKMANVGGHFVYRQPKNSRYVLNRRFLFEVLIYNA